MNALTLPSVLQRSTSVRALDEDQVVDGLRAARKRLPHRLLRDTEAAALVERIHALEAYYPARVERALLDRHLVQIAHQVGPEARVVEPGIGDPSSTRRLLQALERPSSYVAIDAAHDPLHAFAAAVRGAVPGVEIQPVVGDYTRPFELPPPQHEWLRTLLFFPGSAIGTFEPSEVRSLLAMLARIAGPDRLLLVGADATRDPDALLRAYDDDGGVTAARDKHLLAQLNRTRGATFDLDAFEHRAVWNAQASRVELHLVSKTQQIVRLGGTTIAFSPGEPIVTEHCYKHTPAAMQSLLATAGWRSRQVFTSTEVPFRLWLCEPLVG